MASNLITSIFAKPSLQIVDQSTLQISAKNLKISKVTIRYSSEGLRHQMEDGSTQIDSRILKPTKIIMDVFCPDLDTLEEVNNILLNRTTIYQITSRGLIIPDMIIDGETIKQGPEMISATPIRISMKGLMLENVSPIVLANPADASIIDKGIQLIDEAKANVTDLYTKASAAARRFIG